jgi:hypothetical protein
LGYFKKIETMMGIHGDISWDVSSYARGKYHEIEILLHPPNITDMNSMHGLESWKVIFLHLDTAPF